jgi:hypothetical protein
MRIFFLCLLIPLCFKYPLQNNSAGNSAEPSENRVILDVVHPGVEHDVDSGVEKYVDPILSTPPTPSTSGDDVDLGLDPAVAQETLRGPVMRESPSTGHVPGSSSGARSSTLPHHDPASPLDPAIVPESMCVASFGSSMPASSTTPPTTIRPSTQLQDGIWKSKTYTDGILRYGLIVIGKLQDHHQALSDEKWKVPMDHEYNALLKNNTWHMVPRK